MLPEGFVKRPVAHRALHDITDGRPENSRAAIRAAIDAGYAIEIDLQLSSDGRAMVFHDYDLGRLTASKGPVRRKSSSALAEIALLHGSEGIPSFAQVLELVAGRVPLLVEIKDQDGAMGPQVGALEAAAAQDLAGYDGDVALMSFNPNSMAEMARLMPHLPRGLTTCEFSAEGWPTLPREVRERLREIPDYDRVGACFISHNWQFLHAPRIAELAARGASVLSWTTRSPEEDAVARRIACNVTFEGYAA